MGAVRKQGLLLIFFWIIAIYFIVWQSLSLPYTSTFPYAAELLNRYHNRFLTTWLQFDGVHYLTIAGSGYEGTGLIQAFFPLYPLLMRLLSFGVLDEGIVGLLISIGSFFAAFYFLYKLILIDEPNKITKKTFLILLLYPVSFFFISLYTESLFLLLIVASFYAARKQKWQLAGILGLLSATTRLVGIFMLPALLFEYWTQYKKIKVGVIWCLGPLVGLLLYMTYLWLTFGDPMLFYHVQTDFGAGRTATELVLLPQVFYRYFMMLITTPFSNPIYPILVQELLAGLFGMIGLIISWFKLRKSYVLFGIGVYLLPTLTGTFSSLSRYLLPIFPLFLLLAKYLPKKLFIAYLVISVFVLIYNVIRFTQGLWVA